MISPLLVLPLPVGQMQANCYILFDKKTRECTIVDPGDDADFIIRRITDMRARPTKILATHGHFDHILAVGELRLAYSIPFFIHKDDAFLVANMADSAKHFLNITTDPPPTIDEFLILSKNVSVGKTEFEVISTPGHTPGSVCLYNEYEKILFCGDLLFDSGAVGRVDFSYSDKDKMKQSIKKIMKLPDNLTVYPGHGDSFELGKLKNQFASTIAFLG